MAGLYIHIPFCASKCSYCDFYSCTLLGERDAFVGALLREMEARRDYLNGESVQTIYFGGGTPSLLSAAQIDRIFEGIYRLFDIQAKEITLEANPDDLSTEYLAELAMTPIDRLSIGIQSFDDGHLKLMNRRHTGTQAEKAIYDAQKAGFTNISADLIFGIPGMDEGTWEQNIDRMLTLGIQHISAYHLTIESGTPMAAMAARGEIVPADEDTSERQYRMLREKLSGAGFEHYEISNFALPGRMAQHNSSYWAGQPYLGLGPSAHSYDRSERRWCDRDTRRYLSEIPAEGIYESETLTPEDIYNEYIMVRLRTASGIDLAEMERKFGSGRTTEFIRNAEKFIQNGTLENKNSNISVPPEKFMISDRIISDLFEA